jgi:hypothetical protein
VPDGLPGADGADEDGAVGVGLGVGSEVVGVGVGLGLGEGDGVGMQMMPRMHPPDCGVDAARAAPLVPSRPATSTAGIAATANVRYAALSPTL